MKKIGIVRCLSSSRLTQTFEKLGKILDLSFEQCAFGEGSNVEAWVLPEADRESLTRVSASNRPCYVVVNNDQLIPCGKSPTITFSKHHALTSILHGRRLNTEGTRELKALPQWLSNIKTLASKEGVPVWGIQEYNKLHHHFVSVPIPEMQPNVPSFAYFNGNCFFPILPLLLFLKSVNGDQYWEPPPQLATIMFDDPNLHAPVYGFINFSRMLEHAKLHKYHVSFATIPLDGWFVHRPTASLFRKNMEWLSLLIHGNDHISDELGRSLSTDRIACVLRQALDRITKMEHKTGVRVARIMAPPHGACNEESLSMMAKLGLEAACISSGSLHYHNKNATWPLTIGFRTCDTIAGLPVFSRFALSSNFHNNIIIAALLHQPIIARAHHQDISDGLNLLQDVSEFINSLGKVTWADMQSISRSQYARILKGDTLFIRMLSKRISVRIPEGIKKIHVEKRGGNNASSEFPPLFWREFVEHPNWIPHKVEESIPVRPGTVVEILSTQVGSIINEIRVAKPRIYPMVRRTLTETRDRILPVIHRLRHGLKGR